MKAFLFIFLFFSIFVQAAPSEGFYPYMICEGVVAANQGLDCNQLNGKQYFWCQAQKYAKSKACNQFSGAGYL
ncbi:MAG: hypothetical protein ACK5V3_08845, partial [Bdellovibrionales bacterium]